MTEAQTQPGPRDGSNPGSEEDRRSAATIEATIVGSVGTAAVTILVIAGTILAYGAANFQSLAVFLLCLGGSVFFMLLAGYFSAKAVIGISDRGYKGQWAARPKGPFAAINAMQYFFVVGIVLLGVALYFGFHSKPKPAPKIVVTEPQGLSKAIDELTSIDGRLAAADARLARADAQLTRLISTDITH